MTVLGAPLAVRLPVELRERVSQLAAATRRSQGDVIREVLERDLSRLEFEHRVLERAAAVRSGSVQAIPAADVDRMLGLEDASVPAGALDDVS
ncbi:type II toxin-antitoxin system RelB family antitoxin [Microbacterium sp.]|uniref:type II toxin-antitoxin system RelB family antitoxin n=1 Tax=Microbacterium sp. TaxID=51671 RepID=UPI003F95A189